VSGAPGFWIGNVIVMAGVPSIMQAMLDEVGPKLKTGIRILSETVRADVRESDIASQLGEIAKANPGVAIGSHPFFDPRHGPNTNVVLRASDAQKLKRAKRAVENMLQRGAGSAIEQRLRATGSHDAYPLSPLSPRGTQEMVSYAHHRPSPASSAQTHVSRRRSKWTKQGQKGFSRPRQKP
jgi:hypothetical protein